MAQTKPHYDANVNDKTSIKQADGSYKIYPKGLNIVWGNDERYWHKPDKDESPAELIQVSWLEVTGSVAVEAGKKYSVSFNVSLKSDAFGWSNCQVYVMAKVGKKGRYTWKKTALKPEKTSIPPEKVTVSVDNSRADDRTLYFGLYEVWSGKWKGGLIIHEANVKVETS